MSKENMTLEEMAQELRAAGWTVEPKVQGNCHHPRMIGDGGVASDGSGFSQLRCPDCGFVSRSDWGPRLKEIQWVKKFSGANKET